jgi:hypothetical protein
MNECRCNVIERSAPPELCSRQADVPAAHVAERRCRRKAQVVRDALDRAVEIIKHGGCVHQAIPPDETPRGRPGRLVQFIGEGPPADQARRRYLPNAEGAHRIVGDDAEQQAKVHGQDPIDQAQEARRRATFDGVEDGALQPNTGIVLARDDHAVNTCTNSVDHFANTGR